MRVDRGVAHQDVDPAPLLASFRDEVFELRFVGDARRDRDRLAALGADRRRGLVARLLVARRDHDPGAGFGEGLGDRRPMPRDDPVTIATLPVRSNRFIITSL